MDNEEQKKRNTYRPTGGAPKMFDLMKLPQVGDRDEHVDVGSGLSRFKKETGVDFFDLVNDKQLRVKCLVGGVDNRDTDDDEDLNQQFFGSIQNQSIKENTESE